MHLNKKKISTISAIKYKYTLDKITEYCMVQNKLKTAL